MTHRLGIVTIGQAPRSDIMPAIGKILGIADYVHTGVLDDVPPADILALAPSSGEDVLTSRLRDGSSVLLSRERLLPLLQKELTRLENDGCEFIWLLCTGTFPEIVTKCSLLIEPDSLIAGILAKINRGQYTLGVLVPLAEQIPGISSKFTGISRVVYDCLSPYEAYTDNDVSNVAAYFRDENCQLVLLDCMGYPPALKKRLMADTGLPVVLSNEFTASLLAKMLTV